VPEQSSASANAFGPQDFAGDARQAFPARMFGLIFFVIGGSIVLFGWTLAAVTAYAGRCIKRRAKYTFCRSQLHAHADRHDPWSIHSDRADP
jgi:hypothetical protein